MDQGFERIFDSYYSSNSNNSSSTWSTNSSLNKDEFGAQWKVTGGDCCAVDDPTVNTCNGDDLPMGPCSASDIGCGYLDTDCGALDFWISSGCKKKVETDGTGFTLCIIKEDIPVIFTPWTWDICWLRDTSDTKSCPVDCWTDGSCWFDCWSDSSGGPCTLDWTCRGDCIWDCWSDCNSDCQVDCMFDCWIDKGNDRCNIDLW